MAQEYIFPLYPQDATQTVTATAISKEFDVTGRVITVSAAQDVAGKLSLPDLPVGLVFTLKCGAVPGTASVVVTGKDGVSVETLDAANETVTLMILEAGAFTVLAPTVTDSSSADA